MLTEIICYGYDRKYRKWKLTVCGGDEETAFKVCAQVGQRPIGLGGLKASRATPIIDDGAVPAMPSRLYVSKPKEYQVPINIGSTIFSN